MDSLALSRRKQLMHSRINFWRNNFFNERPRIENRTPRNLYHRLSSDFKGLKNTFLSASSQNHSSRHRSSPTTYHKWGCGDVIDRLTLSNFFQKYCGCWESKSKLFERYDFSEMENKYFVIIINYPCLQQHFIVRCKLFMLAYGRLH